MKAFAFPGQGSQNLGMGRAFYEQSPRFRRVLEEANGCVDFDLTRLLFEGPEEQLRLTLYTQPAVFAVSYATFAELEQRGLLPGVALGHSLGELTAVVAAGCLPFEEGTRLVRERARLMHEVGEREGGGMVALLGRRREEVESLLRRTQGVAEIANLNEATQIVVACDRRGLETLRAVCEEERVRLRVLPVSAPFHSSLMRHPARRFAARLEAQDFAPPRFPVISNATGTVSRTAEEIKERLIRQMDHPVLFARSLQEAKTLGVTSLVEVGPGRVLSSMAKRFDPGWLVASVAEPKDLEALQAREAEQASDKG